MIVFYSRTGTTKRCAEALAAARKETLFELKPLRSPGLLGGILQSITGRKAKVRELPDVTGESVLYICSPVWAGRIAPAVRYFVSDSILFGKEIKLLLTCQSASDSYEAACRQEFSRYGLNLSGVLVMPLGPGELPDPEKLMSL